MRYDTPQQLSPISIALHWLVALMIIGLLISGLVMTRTEDYSIYAIHKSIGITVFVIALLRVIWRWRNGWPVPVSDFPAWQHMLSRVSHYILIISTLMMPISGMVMNYFGGRGLYWFGNALIEKSAQPINKTIAGIGHETHHILAFMLIVTLGLHLLGALKHHFIDKDSTLRRMLKVR